MIPVDANGTVALVDEEDLLPAILLCSWHLDSDGYVLGVVNNQHIALHRFIAKRMGLNLDQTIDHEDRNLLNCKRSNLREASRQLQSLNRKVQSNNKSGHKCICWHAKDNKWRVQITRDKIQIHVAMCDSLEEAIIKRDEYIKQNKLDFIE